MKCQKRSTRPPAKTCFASFWIPLLLLEQTMVDVVAPVSFDPSRGTV
ncbi:hypothetical protein [Archangium sp.]|nr:hypothetical protein [Archangium sp.]HYO57059.1 hypothetical protein [Archangium sp.]